MVQQKNQRDFPAYLFHQGTNYQAQDLLGAHMTEDGTTEFLTWAPHAKAVSVVGEFNDWGRGQQWPMERITGQGLWQGSEIGRASCRERV